MNKTYVLGLWVVTLFVCAATTQAATLSFDSFEIGAADATIVQSSPNSQFGISYTALEVGAGSRSLVAFDVSALAGQYSSIDGITLRLTTSYNQAAVLVNIHEALASWVESQVTWNDRMTATPWGTAGGDFSPTVLGSINSDTLAPGSGFDSVQEQVIVSLLPGSGNAAARKALLDAWTSGSNFGLMLESNSAGLVGFRDRSRLLDSDRPLLIIDFSVPVQAAPIPEPTTLALIGGGLFAFAILRRRKRNNPSARV